MSALGGSDADGSLEGWGSGPEGGMSPWEQDIMVVVQHCHSIASWTL